MSPRRLEFLVRDFYDFISKPMQMASLFYVYYYLVDVEGVRELRRAFMTLNNKLEESFYWYGIYSCSEHISYATEGVLEIGEGVHEKGYEISDFLVMAHGTVRKRVTEYSKYINDHLQSTREEGKGLEYIKNKCFDAEDNIKCFSKPDLFLETAELLFDLSRENTKGMCWWDEDYGGESWAKICRTLRRRGSVSTTIFNDACWGMQHNTGIWLNYILAEEQFWEAPRHIGKNLDELEKLLDDNFEGEIEKVFNVAVRYDKSLEAYRRLVK